MSYYLAVDPGNRESAYCVVDDGRTPIFFDKVPNTQLLGEIRDLMLGVDRAAIEMVASYGMAVGADVFETCVWIGRYIERADGELEPVFRRDVKLHHCGSARAKDANIAQALVDRFAPGEPNRGKGTKREPGWFYGFHSDIWQSYALAVYLADRSEGVAA